jgi:predicted site-specific integrase-resolvase
MTMFGYARVSTHDQNLTGQTAELMAAGCAKVYREKASGAKSDRAELAKVSVSWRKATCWLSHASTGWHDPRAIF